MGRSLVRALFPDEVLLRSNYRGGSSKIDKNAAKRPSLDSGIMKAIKEPVMQKFPNDFKQVLFGMVINNVMTELRRQNKLADFGSKFTLRLLKMLISPGLVFGLLNTF
ncbi:hypothetical protein KQX54_016406 [Cotesia glomerata]|uniref:BEN domain-containing protein n=1 Tax=Cotesia glomerata TaxID=32391 RepID=A0AAV7IFX2_COTGL|nr:hypothetical protein KQX54_016406 [Cotesia glomerata]